MRRHALLRCALVLSSLSGCSHVNAETHDAGVYPAIVQDAGVPSVLEYHKNPSRDGLSIDPALNAAALAAFHQDPGFAPALDGAIYAQPLFMENGPQGKDALFVVTEKNWAYALDARDGQVLWQRQVAAPAAVGLFGCGNIDPLGITCTPVIDPGGRTLFFDAMTVPAAGGSPRHVIFALSIEDGSLRWQLDVASAVPGFDSTVQNQRGALTILDGKLVVPFGGFYGDCGNYHGWVVAVPLAAPTTATSFVTGRRGSAIWAPSGVASDGFSLFVSTGNGFGAASWGDAFSEAVLRLAPSPTFSGFTDDYFAPGDWKALDDSDTDLGSSGVVLFDIPNENPSHLAFAIGKPGVARLLSRDGLGGINGSVSALGQASNKVVLGSIAAYTTSTRSYVVFSGTNPNCSGDLTALSISAGAPPSLAFAWCASQNGRGSPMVTSSDGAHDFLVWGLGVGGDQKLHAFDGDTGHELYTSPALANLARFMTPVEAKGRVYVAGSGTVTAFTAQ